MEGRSGRQNFAPPRGRGLTARRAARGDRDLSHSRGLLLPTVGKSKSKAEALTCANNRSSFPLAAALACRHNQDVIVNNHGVCRTARAGRRQTWAKQRAGLVGRPRNTTNRF